MVITEQELALLLGKHLARALPQAQVLTFEQTAPGVQPLSTGFVVRCADGSEYGVAVCCTKEPTQ